MENVGQGSTGPNQVPEPSTSSATTSPSGKMNQDEINSHLQSSSFLLQYLSTKHRFWGENNLREAMQSTLENTIQILGKRSALSGKMKTGAEAIKDKERTVEDKETEHKEKRKAGTRMRLEMLASCSTKQTSIWNETIEQFNTDGIELKSKSEDLKKLYKHWCIVDFLLKKVEEEAGHSSDMLFDLIEKLINGPAGCELTDNDKDIISRLKMEQNGSMAQDLLGSGHSGFNLDNRNTLSSVIEKEYFALQDLIGSHKMFKTHPFREEMCNEITEAIDLHKQTLLLVTDIQKSGSSIVEAEQLLSKKASELETFKTACEEYMYKAKMDFRKGDYNNSHVATANQIEAMKKVEEVEKADKKKLEAINTRLEQSVRRLKELENNWEVIKSIASSLENQKDNKIDRKRKDNLLDKFLKNPVLNSQQLDPDEKALLSHFTKNNESHKDEPVSKKNRLEVKKETGALKRRSERS
ncbi:hypothetical protein L5515_015568 [Caenorhabditis briggsae]|uniref:Uncharacterized protein n=1 Tax=Caenorhabditis briggsae TaxID=6238 RepID=A0AAE9JA52_CAEBR|nr:hypothetical protein L5515_015568 [Caenorhabditis briggsae]